MFLCHEKKKRKLFSEPSNINYSISKEYRFGTIKIFSCIKISIIKQRYTIKDRKINCNSLIFKFYPTKMI